MKRLRLFVLFCLLGSAVSTILQAQTGPADSTAPAVTAGGAADSKSPETATGSPAQSSSAQTKIVEYAPPPAEYARAKAYSRSTYRHFFVNAFYGLLILLVVLRWRVSAAFRNLAERVSANRGLQWIVFSPLILLTIAIFDIPADIWDQSLSRAYGLSVQTWGAWTRDWVVSQIIGAIVGTLLVGILYFVIRRSPRRWWFYFWLASIPVVAAILFLQPLVVDPLFYKFTPLQSEHAALVSEMQKVIQRGGMEIPSDRMFLMNASSKTTGLNAYVTGFGASKRVVVWDNTIAKATVSETLFVFGHEMGHYVLLHIPKEITIFALVLLVLLYIGYRLSNWMLSRFGTQWGVRDLQDWASLPALIFVITLLAFFATPVFNAVSRHFEHEADRYGLEVIHGIVADPNQVAAHYFEKSGEKNLSDPDPSPFVKAWFFDHPTRPERVHFVATYDPWSNGKTPEYVK